MSTSERLFDSDAYARTAEGRVRLVRIGTEDEQVDLQPCGGTHVGRTAEIGRIRIGKIEKKGKQNRRIYLHLEG